jgi:multidrug resistance efflux pump
MNSDGSEQPEHGSTATEGTEAEASSSATSPPARDGTPTAKRIRRITLIVLGLCAALFIWHVFADRFTPMTNEARVRGFVVPIIPQVSGYVIDVEMGLNRPVEQGHVLVKIDPTKYEAAVRKAKAALEQAGQEIGANTAAVGAAQARLAEARARLWNAEVQSKRILGVAEGVVAKSQQDAARAALNQARASVRTAEAELNRAKHQLGAEGQANPRIQSALGALEQAQFDLAQTVIRAPSDGGVTNRRIDVGYFANPGKSLMTFVSKRGVWVEAYMRENCLGNIEVGDSAELTLDVAPGRVFEGEVVSIGYGVASGLTSTVGGLPKVEGRRGWLREAQRFPVIIRFKGEEAHGFRREGGQASAIVYTGGNFILNGLGGLWIRISSLLSYVY